MLFYEKRYLCITKTILNMENFLKICRTRKANGFTKNYVANALNVVLTAKKYL